MRFLTSAAAVRSEGNRQFAKAGETVERKDDTEVKSKVGHGGLRQADRKQPSVSTTSRGCRIVHECE